MNLGPRTTLDTRSLELRLFCACNGDAATASRRRSICDLYRVSVVIMRVFCLLVFISSSQGLVACGRRAGLTRVPTAAHVRGGTRARCRQFNDTFTIKAANASQPSAQSKASARKASRSRAGARDAVTAVLGLSAAGAVQWCCNRTSSQRRWAVPGHVRKQVWVVLSGTLAAILFLFLRITNPPGPSKSTACSQSSC